MKLDLRLSIAFLTALLASPAIGEDRRPDRTSLSIVTINAEFLWDGLPPEEGSSAVEFPWKGSSERASAHMNDIAALIRRADADIVNLVEVENEQALTLLRDRYLEGMGYEPYFIQGTDTFTGQDVALLTRVDPEGGVIHRESGEGRSGGTSKSVSKNQYATFDVQGRRIAMVGLHFLARPSDPERREARQAQADAILKRALLLKEQGHELVVLGDFNDFDGAGDALDAMGHEPISTVLAQVRGMDAADDADDLVNIASFLPPQRRYTAFWDRNENGEIDGQEEFSSIDHILLSPVLARAVREADILQEFDPREVSDHFPILVRLDLAAVPIGAEPQIDNLAADSPIKIVSLFPNPTGDEMQEEAVTLRNSGEESVPLDGWSLIDKTGSAWRLTGVLEPGKELTVQRRGQPMALNNGGDVVELRNPMGQLVQQVVYGRVRADEVVPVP